MSAKSDKNEKDGQPSRLKAVGAWLAGVGGERRGVMLRAFACVLAVGVLIGGAVWGLGRLKKYVDMNPRRAHVAVQVRLHGQPAWMPDSLARKIAGSLLPADADLNDPDLTSRAHDAAAAIQWVARVQQVAKAGTDNPGQGIVDVYAEFRQPVARVLSADGRSVLYVSSDARLIGAEAPLYVARLAGEPSRTASFMNAREIPANVRAVPIHYITIRGVKASAPAVGQAWAGADLADAMRLVQLLWNQPYANQIAEIDVRNHDGRVDRGSSHICMTAGRAGSATMQIMFGRFPWPEGDWSVPIEQKLANLSAYAAGHGGLLAGTHKQIDLRYNPMLCGSGESPAPVRAVPGSRRGETPMELTRSR